MCPLSLASRPLAIIIYTMMMVIVWWNGWRAPRCLVNRRRATHCRRDDFAPNYIYIHAVHHQLIIIIKYYILIAGWTLLLPTTQHSLYSLQLFQYMSKTIVRCTFCANRPNTTHYIHSNLPVFLFAISQIKQKTD